MKFFYAIIVFFLSVFIFFWALVFLIPTPVNYRIGDILQDQESAKTVDPSTYTLAVNTSKKLNDDNKYIFDANIESKKSGALFLVSLTTFVIIFFQIVIFHKRSYILFPMVAATVVAYFLYSCLWIFLNTLPSLLYLDINNIRDQYKGLLALQFLGVYLFVFLLILVLGNWSRLKDI